MTRGARPTQAVMLAANVVWFGGLMRLLGEAVARLLSEMAPTESDQRTVVAAVLGGIVVLGIEVLLLWRWSWYRGVIRQTREDVRSLWGLPPKATPPIQVTFRRTATSSAIVLVPALVVAFLLPGAVAAAIAVIVGLVVRVAVVAVAVATSTSSAQG
ncbi:MAG TPA: hypothetical protein VIM39_02480 [Candidatus Limnocylindrales bacterium]